MGSLGRKQGENVKITYVGAPGAEAVAVLLYDANDAVRTLHSYERLVIDEIQFNTEATDASNLAFLIEAAVAPTAPPAAGLGVVASFSITPNIGSQGQVFPGEGFACHIGNTLFLLDDGNGWSGSEVSLVGAGRIVADTGLRGFQAGYKALLTPGGVPGQNF